MRVGIISLFPDMFVALDHGIVGRAQKQGLLTLNHWNPRDYTQDKHRNVDDRPYGGGPGMVMMVQPLRDAIRAAKTAMPTNSRVIYLSPQGKRFNQTAASSFVNQPLILVAGRYEGVDERLLATEVDEEWSVGDYVLSGGELAAMVMIDAITRLIPDALGDEDSAKQDSFVNGLLDYPHYTRPETIDSLAVPEVLLSGDHAAIQRWRLQQALGKTWMHRKDLLQKYPLDEEQKKLLAEFIEAANAAKTSVEK